LAAKDNVTDPVVAVAKVTGCERKIGLLLIDIFEMPFIHQENGHLETGGQLFLFICREPSTSVSQISDRVPVL
jgi:hypothetical protein